MPDRYGNPTDAERAEFLLKQSKTSEFLEEKYSNCGVLLWQISKLKETFNETWSSIQYLKRVNWYQGNLIKRVLKKFKVKEIYRSKKAYPYYLKYINKHIKINPKPVLEDMPKQMIIGYLTSMERDDKKNAEIYQYVINKLKDRGQKWHY